MLEPILCGPLLRAPLLPKLRGHFAEFLNNASPAGLRILSSSTCVGLWYGYSILLSGFSRHKAYVLPYLYFGPHHAFGLCGGFAYRTAPLLAPVFPFPAYLIPLRPHISKYCSAGISTCCPSATPFGLALGPDLPRADQLYPGNLGYSAVRILTSLSLLIPAFSLPDTPLLLIGTASTHRQCSSTNV